MSTSKTQILDVTDAAPGAEAPVAQRLTAVVGFDGSEPSRRALAAASRLIAGRPGAIEVVYVVHSTPTESLAPTVAWELEDTFEEISAQLRVEVERLLGSEHRWTFHLGQGEIARSLLAEADSQINGDGDAQVVIVVGAPAHRYHQVMGSVPAALVHHSRVPILMVP